VPTKTQKVSDSMSESPDVGKLLEEMPKSTITIEAGRVISLSDWTLWNLVPMETIGINQDEDGKVSGHLSHGGGGRGLFGDSVAEALNQNLHPKIAGPIIEAFALEGATPEAVKALLPKYEVVEI
jgi:hypothetical protein